MSRGLPTTIAKPNGVCRLLLVLLLAAGPVAGRAASQAGKTLAQRAVYVTASFVDRRGLYIEDLQKNEVEILENNQPRQIEFMARDELPTVYGILFDRAMFPESEEAVRPDFEAIPDYVGARDIAYQLIDKLLNRQSLWVGAYDQQLNLLLDAGADGFSAKNAIQELRGVRGNRESFLYSALFSAVDKMNQRHEKRRAIILFLQNLDPTTTGKIKPLKNLLAASDVELFAICYTTRLGNSGGVPSAVTTSTLKELTQVTSGFASFAIDNRGHPEDIVRRLLEHLRTLYTFGFTSQTPAGDNAKLVIKCSRPDSKVRCHPVVPNIE